MDVTALRVKYQTSIEAARVRLSEMQAGQREAEIAIYRLQGALAALDEVEESWHKFDSEITHD